MKTLSSLLLLITTCIFNHANAQVNSVTSKADIFHNVLPIEKLYLTFDKPYYSVGDTLWFKSFLLNGDLTASQRTDKIYIELFNDSLKFIENRVIALNNGLGYGDFALTNKLKEGSYIVRAYTNWQQNFGSDYFFQKSFYIGNADEKTWLLDASQKLNNRTLDLKVRLTNIKNEAIGLKDVEIVLMNEKKRLMKADLQTSLQGIIETKIPLGENKINGNYSFIITDKKDKARQSVLPISLQELDQIDLQFMPEGGHMVNGIFGRVAFKTIGADGLGKDITGRIVNSKNEHQAELKVSHKGMGDFYLMPTAGENYTAIYSLNGKEIKQLLPTAKQEGTTLRIDQLSKSDSLFMYIKASDAKKLDGYLLLAQAAQETLLSANINLKNGFSTLKLAKQDFPDGIIHFTLFSPEGTPVNERQAFINRKQKINIKIEDVKVYQPRDSISLDITATKEDGSPLSGSFSIAVTDDGQVKQNHDETIASYFLLQSDLKGNIEEPSWYFKDESPATLLALDHLLLTQGWVGYNWNEVLAKTPEVKFKAEKGSSIQGKLLGPFNKPAANINLTLLSLGKTIYVTDTISNTDGNFFFKDIPTIDSPVYTIKIKNAKGKTSNATILVDEYKNPSDITKMSLVKPWYINTDSLTLNFYKNTVKQKTNFDAIKQNDVNLLKEVVIRGQKKANDFVMEVAWDAYEKMHMGEEELKKTPGKTLLTLLKEKIEGFNAGSLWAESCSAKTTYHNYVNFCVGSRLISHVIIDKLNTHFVSSGARDRFNETGVSLTANDSRIFEVNNYIFKTLKAADILEINLYKGCAYFYLEITTRSGKGPFIGPSEGLYIYRPLPIYISKDFYSPKYSSDKSFSTPDYRATLFWDANVVTDENGKAKISFYAADKPTTYTIKIEGTDLYGRFGYHTSNIKIVNQTESK